MGVKAWGNAGLKKAGILLGFLPLFDFNVFDTIMGRGTWWFAESRQAKFERARERERDFVCRRIKQTSAVRVVGGTIPIFEECGLACKEGGNECAPLSRVRLTIQFMQLPVNLPLSDSPTIITAYTESTDGTSTWTYTTYYHIPMVYHLLVVFLFMFILSRVVIEFVIRIRKPTERRFSGL